MSVQEPFPIPPVCAPGLRIFHRPAQFPPALRLFLFPAANACQPNLMIPPLAGVLETCLYVDDLDAAEAFYTRVLGAEAFLRESGRHVFLRLGRTLVFLFRAEASRVPTAPGHGLPIPTHGATGPGHVAFEIASADFGAWETHLNREAVPIEETIDWPNGARSLYFRDPAGNSLEVVTRSLWAGILDAPSA